MPEFTTTNCAECDHQLPCTTGYLEFMRRKGWQDSILCALCRIREQRERGAA